MRSGRHLACWFRKALLVVLGFNPLSIIGLRRAFKHRTASAPWCGTYFGAARLRDWLTLLGFDIVDQRPCFPVDACASRLAPGNSLVRGVDTSGARERWAHSRAEARQRSASGALAMEAPTASGGRRARGSIGEGRRW